MNVLNEKDIDLMVKYDKESLNLIETLHELLGHRAGNLLSKNVDTGELNFHGDWFTTTSHLRFSVSIASHNILNSTRQRVRVGRHLIYRMIGHIQGRYTRALLLHL